MSETQGYQCSHCGKQEATDIRYLACGSTSQWDKNNYPVPNTTFTTKDDIKVWKVALCDSCMPQSYKVFLQNRKKKAVKTMGWCSLCLAAAIVGGFAGATKVWGLLGALLNVALGIALLIGVIGVPANIIIYIINSIRLRNIDQIGIIPEKNQDKCFQGEGERIIKEMEKDKPNHSESIWGDFPLPMHMELKELPMPENEKKKILHEKYGERERSILSVSRTSEELENALQPEWQSLWRLAKEK